MTDGKISLAKKAETLRTILAQNAQAFAKVAPKYLNVERMLRLLISAGSRNPKIFECSPQSVLALAMKCAETGLEPIGAGGAYAIPYENKKNGTVELTFLPDYRGLINAAKNAGCVKTVIAEVVREKDDFDYSLGLNPDLRHKPATGSRGEITHVYGIWIEPDGSKHFIVMDRGEVESIRNRSQAWRAFKKYGKECPWNTDEGEMFKKTITRRIGKQWIGISVHFDKAMEYDNEIDGMVKVTDEKPEIEMPKEKEIVVDPKANQENEPDGQDDDNDDPEPTGGGDEEGGSEPEEKPDSDGAVSNFELLKKVCKEKGIDGKAVAGIVAATMSKKVLSFADLKKKLSENEIADLIELIASSTTENDGEEE